MHDVVRPKKFSPSEKYKYLQNVATGKRY